MSKVLRCRDAGIDCEYVIRGDSEDDIMRQAIDHATTVHGMQEISPDLVDKVRAAIRDERDLNW